VKNRVGPDQREHGPEVAPQPHREGRHELRQGGL